MKIWIAALLLISACSATNDAELTPAQKLEKTAWEVFRDIFIRQTKKLEIGDCKVSPTKAMEPVKEEVGVKTGSETEKKESPTEKNNKQSPIKPDNLPAFESYKYDPEKMEFDIVCQNGQNKEKTDRVVKSEAVYFTFKASSITRDSVKMLRFDINTDQVFGQLEFSHNLPNFSGDTNIENYITDSMITFFRMFDSRVVGLKVVEDDIQSIIEQLKDTPSGSTEDDKEKIAGSPKESERHDFFALYDLEALKEPIWPIEDEDFHVYSDLVHALDEYQIKDEMLNLIEQLGLSLNPKSPDKTPTAEFEFAKSTLYYKIVPVDQSLAESEQIQISITYDPKSRSFLFLSKSNYFSIRMTLNTDSRNFFMNAFITMLSRYGGSILQIMNHLQHKVNSDTDLFSTIQELFPPPKTDLDDNSDEEDISPKTETKTKTHPVTLSSIGKFIVIDVINSGITVFLKISEAKKAKGSKTMTKTTKFVRAFPNNSQYDLLPFIEIYILDLINQGKLQVIFEELEWKRNPALLFDFLPLELIFSFKLEFESDRKKTNRCSDGLEHSKVILVNRQDFSVSSEYLKQLSLFWYGDQEFTNETDEEKIEEKEVPSSNEASDNNIGEENIPEKESLEKNNIKNMEVNETPFEEKNEDPKEWRSPPVSDGKTNALRQIEKSENPFMKKGNKLVGLTSGNKTPDNPYLQKNSSDRPSKMSGNKNPTVGRKHILRRRKLVII
jgi:hypothetical protein